MIPTFPPRFRKGGGNGGNGGNVYFLLQVFTLRIAVQCRNIDAVKIRCAVVDDGYISIMPAVP